MINFGKKKPDIRKYAIIGIVLASIITALSQCSGISENKLWDLFDEFQRKYFPLGMLNEFVVKDPEKLKRRIERDVDKAIHDVTSEYDRIILEADRIYKPHYVEEKNDESVCYSDECKKLAPPMRICAPWKENCNYK